MRETAAFHDDTLDKGIVIGIQETATTGGIALGSAFDTMSAPNTTSHTNVTANNNTVRGGTLR